MKKISVIILSLLVSVWTIAADRTEGAMRQIAARQLSAVPAAIEQVLANKTFSVYQSEEGFVVVGKSQNAPAVLGYSSTAFPMEKMPCGLRWWLDATEKSLNRNDNPDSYGDVAGDNNTVDNFVETTWGQDSPFNDFCPKVNNVAPPCGCVATAMAQILYYFKYPEQGRGMGSYRIGNGQPVETEVNGVYNWSMIPSFPLSSGSRRVIKNAVATVTRDCGYSVGMQYEEDGSGAYTFDAARAFAVNFRYDPYAVQYVSRYFYARAPWHSMLAAEIRAKRPVLYAANDSQMGGHAFVISGLDADGLFYVNWGWNGSADGYYNLDTLTPTIDDTPLGYQFTVGQEMVIGLKAQEEPDEGEIFRSAFGSMYDMDDVRASGTNSLTIPYFCMLNIHYMPFQGEVGLLLENEDGVSEQALLPLMETEGEEIPCLSGWEDRYISCDFTEVPIGVYRMYYYSKAEGETEPQKALEYGGAGFTSIYVSKDAAGKMKVSKTPITSGISILDATTAEKPSSIYSITGMRLSTHPVRRGFYIVNGRKVLR